MNNPRVIVSQSGRQHSHQSAFALQERGFLCRYYSVFWYNKSILRKIETFLPCWIVKELKKRNYESIDVSYVKINYFIFLLEALLKSLNTKNYSYLINCIFDKWVSAEIKSMDFDIFFGFETTSLESFRICKRLDKICLLDLPIAHYKKQQELLSSVNYSPYGNKKTANRINKNKEAELQLADYVIVPSDFVKQTLLDSSVPEKKIIKIPYGVDLDIFRLKENYRKEGKFKILYVGAITIRKGLKYLLEAYKNLGLRNSELILVGGMADGKYLLKECKGLYSYTPFVTQKELNNFYQEADIFVFPSILEGFAQVVIEAMACGTPVIVTPNTGSCDAVRDGVDGFIVPIMNVEKLEEKILYFYENRDKTEEMGRNARAQAEKYSWENYREKIRELILKISQQSLAEADTV